MRDARLVQKTRQFFGLPGADKKLILQAIYWLAVSRVWLAVRPFGRLVEGLRYEGVAKVADPELLQRIGSAVAAAGRNVPWRSDCFPQAITAHRLLSKAGYESVVHFGVNNSDESDFKGHAWVTCGDTVVVGGAEMSHYSEVFRTRP